MEKFLLVIASAATLVCATRALAAENEAVAISKAILPTTSWPGGTPSSVGLDEDALKSFDADIAGGKYSMTDSFEVFRCGTQVFARQYRHDYARIYAREAKTKGPLNSRLNGRYNYYSAQWHPFYHGTNLHTMQSVSKTVTAMIYGVAITRGDFKAPLSTSVLKYFDVAQVKNVDERKRDLTIENLLTMTSGMNSEELFYPPNSDSRENDFVYMEATDDWVRYAIDQPIVEEPGKNFVYSSASTELLAYVFQKETGQDIDAYAEKYLFAPLGIRHYWKRDYVGTVDTEGGLYLAGEDLAKLGLLYLNHGVWGGKQIVSEKWIEQSVSPHVPMPYTVDGGRLFWGLNWWLYPLTDGYAWIASGLGGQELLIFPKLDLIVVFTGWDIPNEPDLNQLMPRLLSAVKQASCTSQ